MNFTRDLSDVFRHVSKISIIDAKKTLYSVTHVLQKKNIFFEENNAIELDVLPDDVDYPTNSKITDSGQLNDFSIKIEVYNQNSLFLEALESFVNKKVIVVIWFNNQKIIFGCNEQPLKFLYNELDTTNPSGSLGVVIKCTGSSYFSKVIHS